MFNNNLNLYKNITIIILFLPSYNKKNNRARMSSLFNSKNNRFDILNSDDNTNKERNKNKEKNRDKSNVKKQEQEQKKEEPRNFNSFKNDSQPFYEDRRNNRRFNERRSVNSKEMEERNKELEKIKKEKEREEALKETNFPDLIQNNPNKPNKKKDENQNQKSNQESNQQQPQPIINFLEKVKNNLTKDEKTEAKNIIKPGWVCMEKATNSNQIIYTYGKQTYFPREPVPIDVLNALVKLHEKQVIQYDSLWGEGAYDEQYKSPYYDYEYFDRLDEQYEDEMERQEQEDRVKEREYDNDYHTY